MNHRHALAATAAGMGLGAGAGIGCYIGLVTGRLTLDLGLGRRVRPLGPLVINIAAPRELVFATAAAPYAERRPRAMQEKVRILERTDQMLLAAHRTPVGGRLTAVTVETVTLDPPNRIGFRLVRGPVPYVVESFTFEPTPDGTRLSYTGELGTDLWWAGELWGDLVAPTWIQAVQTSLNAIKVEAERRLH
jgi:Polyketide cyclase / dehydrase and lipid transport